MKAKKVILLLAADAASKRQFFLGNLLEEFAAREGLDSAGLASHLQVDPSNLSRLRLCKAPASIDDSMVADVEAIAARFDLSMLRLLSLVKDILVSRALRNGESDLGWLMAARDRDDDDQP